METIKKMVVAVIMIFPVVAFAQHQPTSYDSDGDGVPDSVDKCVLVPGAAQFHGCPFVPIVTIDDRDGDGIADVNDACPDMFGTMNNRGCPDVALINTTSGMGNAETAESGTNETILFTSASSSEQQQLKDFKDNLLKVLASSGHMFSDIKSVKNREENDYGTLLCLAGADECYVDLTQHFYANYGTYTDLTVAMDKYESLKQSLRLALGEANWNSNETIEDGIKSFEMRKKDSDISFSPHLTAFIRQTENNSYRVYLAVDSK